MLVFELVQQLQSEDPVGGVWNVKSGNYAVVWCDASSLAIGCAIEVDGNIIEDGAWLRKSNDVLHINIAELEAILKGINLAIKWDRSNIVIKSDSVTAISWSKAAVGKNGKIKVF